MATVVQSNLWASTTHIALVKLFMRYIAEMSEFVF